MRDAYQMLKGQPAQPGIMVFADSDAQEANFVIRRRAVANEAQRILRRRSSKSLILCDSDEEDEEDMPTRMSQTDQSEDDQSVRRPRRSSNSLPRISCDDLVEGQLIGSGAFNDVYSVRLNLRTDNNGAPPPPPRRKTSNASTADETDESDCDPTAHHGQCAYWHIGSDEPGGYVIKHLRQSVMEDIDKFRTGAVDLAYEAKLLQSLSHENIIMIRGVSAGSLAEAFTSDKKRGYFLILDQVHCTLDGRMKSWRERQDRMRLNMGYGNLVAGNAAGRQDSADSSAIASGSGRGLLHRMSSRLALSRRRSSIGSLGADNVHLVTVEREFLAQRLNVALGIARGLEYLHRHRVIYRDIKPANIGIDFHGVVKILDFGIAREIEPDCVSNDDDRYRLTAMTGTLRYMAPEVALASPYGLSADVHSFGIILHEICAMKKPYGDIKDIETFKSKVICDGRRPAPKEWWPACVKELVNDCGMTEPRLRPKMNEVVGIISDFIEGGNLKWEEDLTKPNTGNPPSQQRRSERRGFLRRNGSLELPLKDSSRRGRRGSDPSLGADMRRATSIPSEDRYDAAVCGIGSSHI